MKSTKSGSCPERRRPFGYEAAAPQLVDPVPPGMPLPTTTRSGDAHDSLFMTEAGKTSFADVGLGEPRAALGVWFRVAEGETTGDSLMPSAGNSSAGRGASLGVPAGPHQVGPSGRRSSTAAFACPLGASPGAEVRPPPCAPLPSGRRSSAAVVACPLGASPAAEAGPPPSVPLPSRRRSSTAAVACPLSASHGADARPLPCAYLPSGRRSSTAVVACPLGASPAAEAGPLPSVPFPIGRRSSTAAVACPLSASPGAEAGLLSVPHPSGRRSSLAAVACPLGAPSGAEALSLPRAPLPSVVLDPVETRNFQGQRLYQTIAALRPRKIAVRATSWLLEKDPDHLMDLLNSPQALLDVVDAHIRERIRYAVAMMPPEVATEADSWLNGMDLAHLADLLDSPKDLLAAVTVNFFTPPTSAAAGRPESAAPSASFAQPSDFIASPSDTAKRPVTRPSLTTERSPQVLIRSIQRRRNPTGPTRLDRLRLLQPGVTDLPRASQPNRSTASNRSSEAPLSLSLQMPAMSSHRSSLVAAPILPSSSRPTPAAVLLHPCRTEIVDATTQMLRPTAADSPQPAPSATLPSLISVPSGARPQGLLEPLLRQHHSSLVSPSNRSTPRGRVATRSSAISMGSSHRTSPAAVLILPATPSAAVVPAVQPAQLANKYQSTGDAAMNRHIPCSPLLHLGCGQAYAVLRFGREYHADFQKVDPSTPLAPLRNSAAVLPILPDSPDQRTVPNFQVAHLTQRAVDRSPSESPATEPCQPTSLHAVRQYSGCGDRHVYSVRRIGRKYDSWKDTSVYSIRQIGCSRHGGEDLHTNVAQALTPSRTTFIEDAHALQPLCEPNARRTELQLSSVGQSQRCATSVHTVSPPVTTSQCFGPAYSRNGSQTPAVLALRPTPERPPSIRSVSVETAPRRIEVPRPPFLQTLPPPALLRASTFQQAAFAVMPSFLMVSPLPFAGFAQAPANTRANQAPALLLPSLPLPIHNVAGSLLTSCPPTTPFRQPPAHIRRSTAAHLHLSQTNTMPATMPPITVPLVKRPPHISTRHATPSSNRCLLPRPPIRYARACDPSAMQLLHPIDVSYLGHPSGTPVLATRPQTENAVLPPLPYLQKHPSLRLAANHGTHLNGCQISAVRAPQMPPSSACLQLESPLAVVVRFPLSFARSRLPTPLRISRQSLFHS